MIHQSIIQPRGDLIPGLSITAVLHDRKMDPSFRDDRMTAKVTLRLPAHDQDTEFFIAYNAYGSLLRPFGKTLP